jgi:mono/diheme cytochrome c family protein
MRYDLTASLRYREVVMKRALPILLPIVMLAPPAHGADSAAGKKLYDANCVQCHNASVHTRPDHKIKSLAALDKQLTGCSAGAHMNLSDADRANVEQYLNEQFYKFQ